MLKNLSWQWPYSGSTAYAVMRASRIFPCLLLFCAILSGCEKSAVPVQNKLDTTVEFAASKDSDLVVTINSESLFEAQGNWGPGYIEAAVKGAGVVVGPGGENSNVFAQTFNAASGEPFKLEARAAAGKGEVGEGRFQINWLDAQGKFMSVSSQPFQVTSSEQRFEYYLRAPAGAARGILYVVPNGANIIRYTEMRLLGGPWRKSSQAALAQTTNNDTVVSEKDGLQNTVATAFPKPANLTPLDGSGKPLTEQESQYYFYQAAKAMQRRAAERGMDFILQVMPDYNIQRLMPAIQQLRKEGVKVLAYEPQGDWTTGVDIAWYWQKADSHWREAAVRLTADELLQMRQTQSVVNRPFSAQLMSVYSQAASVGGSSSN